ncbi:MAG: NADH oxidase [Syntrophorhabdus sp. PtaU1.Bin058]|nr:MAG: NADH oxidase [Syntrophorhabdus sp. PtaU1.Bin058]
MVGRTKFEKLLEPGYIGRVRTRNRIIKTASGTGLTEPDGTQGEAIKAYYESLARGGVGMIIEEFTVVEYPRGTRRMMGQSRIDDDKFIKGFSEVVKGVHRHGCPIFLQIMHAGPWYHQAEPPEALGERLSSSALTEAEFLRIGQHLPPHPIVPRETTLADIQEIIDRFGQAAERCQKAGFDGVEVNGSHHHLINCFFSPVWNKRHDQYGCDSLENRARFMCDIIREIKRRCGNDYPVTALFNAAELGEPKATTLEEGKRFGQLLQEAGADALQVRMAGYGLFSLNLLHADRLMHPELPRHFMIREFDWSRNGRGFQLPLAVALKEIATVPVILAGRLDAELGEEALREGKLDFVGMTRRLFADPEYPKKVAEKRLEDIAPCGGCLLCWHKRGLNEKLTCRINPALGNELAFEIKPAEKKKQVMIIGGGPAGMEAARVAALRGHKVVLFEKGHQLGGLMPLAAMVKDKECDLILDQVRYFKTQMSKLGVVTEIGKTAGESSISDIRPDVIVIASGGSPASLNIPGIESGNVVDSFKMHGKLKTALRFLGAKSLERFTKVWMPVGKKVLVIGGAIHGCQLAEFLVKRGKQVTIVDESEKLGEGLLSEDPVRLFPWFEQKKVVMMTGVRYEKITDRGLVVTTREGKTETLEAESIMIALPLTPNPDAAGLMEGKAREVYVIGDCRQAGFMHSAIMDGATVGHKI